AQLGSFAGNEGQIAKGAKGQKLASFFTPDIHISVDAPGVPRKRVSGQDDLLKAAMAVRTYLSGLKVDLLDITITFAPGKTSAVASLTLKVQMNGERDFTPQEMKFTLKKVKGEW